jgi:hypothetical protein
MLQRPTASKIASAYTGNAPALDARIKQEQQADNSISPDLRKLLALQDLTSDEKHMGIDQALKGPMNPPTVAQSLQDRAKQILAARMTQAQQNAGIAQDQQRQMIEQGRPGPVPQGVAQPEPQPEGIDQLQSNVGDAYANGGIVAFNTGNKVEDSAFVRAMKELKEKFSGPTEEDRQIREAQRYFKQQASGMGAFTKGASEYDADRAVSDFVQANPQYLKSPAFRADPAGFVKAATAPTPKGTPAAPPTAAENMAETIRLFSRGETPAEAAVPAEVPATPVKANAATPANKVKPATKDKPVNASIAKPTEQPSIANLPTLPPELPTPVAGSPRDIMGKSMVLDPEAEANRILAAREKLVGAPYTSQYQALIEELRGQKAKLQEKKEPGFERLMDYLGEVAAGPTTGRSGKAGSQAAERLRLRELDKEKQANALSERMIEAAQKQQDALYGYKKEGFALSEGERSRVFTERFNAAKAAGESDDRAKQLGQTAVLERERLKQQAELERERNAATVKAAGIAASRQGELMDIAEALMKSDKTGKLDLQSALQKAAQIKGSSQLSGQDLKGKIEKAKAIMDLEEKFPSVLRNKNSKAAKDMQAAYEAAKANIESIYGADAGAGLNSLPSTGPTSANVRSQADAIISGVR